MGACFLQEDVNVFQTPRRVARHLPQAIGLTTTSSNWRAKEVSSKSWCRVGVKGSLLGFVKYVSHVWKDVVTVTEIRTKKAIG